MSQKTKNEQKKKQQQQKKNLPLLNLFTVNISYLQLTKLFPVYNDCLLLM